MILGTICCRGGSKGVPGKNIRQLHNHPLLYYTIVSAKGSKLIDDLIISTDSEEIASIGSKEGVKIPFRRPAALSADNSSKWDVFKHAVENYEKFSSNQVTYLVDMDVTVPLKRSEDIDGAITLALNNPSADVVITGYEPERNPYFNMMQIMNDGFAEIVKEPEKPITRRQDAPLVYSLTPAAYVVKKEALYKYEHWSKARCKIYPMPRMRAVDIDTEFDFILAEFLMQNNNEK